MPTENAPASMYRFKEGLGLWEHRGKVVAVGVGIAPTARRWDGDPQTSTGALSMIAIRKCLEDAGVSPDQVNGMVVTPDTSTGSPWPPGKPVPEDFRNAFRTTDNPLDGLARLSADWLLLNMPEFTNVKYTAHGPVCMSNSLVVAAQAVGEGLTDTCLVVRGWHNFEGRYYQGQGDRGGDTLGGPGKFGGPLWGVPASGSTAMIFDQYCRKYGKTHDMMTPFILNSKRNGLLFPEGYWAQHRPYMITAEDYLNARWIAKPANLYDNDIPIMVAAAVLFTTPERARDLKQQPVYILNHASTRPSARSVMATLDDWERDSDSTGRKLYEGSGVTPADVTFENMYDGFSLFHHFHMEGLRFAGIKRGEGLDLYQTDISIEGPHPVMPSGGNIGSGRSRFWMSLDSILQLQERAGARQIRKKAEIGISGSFMPDYGDFIVWSATPPV